MALDYSFLIFDTTLLIIGIVAVITLTIWLAFNKSMKWLALLPILGLMLTWGFNRVYDYTLHNDANTLYYKQSIEQGINNGFTENYYSKFTDEEKKGIDDRIKLLNLDPSILNRANIGIKYYYFADYSGFARPYQLAWGVIANTKYAPILIPLALVAMVLMVLVAADRYIRKELLNINKLKTGQEELLKSISIRRDELSRLDALKQHKESELESLGTNILKAKENELIERLNELEYDLDKQKNERKRLNNEIGELQAQINEGRETLQTIHRYKEEEERALRTLRTQRERAERYYHGDRFHDAPQSAMPTATASREPRDTEDITRSAPVERASASDATDAPPSAEPMPTASTSKPKADASAPIKKRPRKDLS